MLEQVGKVSTRRYLAWQPAEIGARAQNRLLGDGPPRAKYWMADRKHGWPGIGPGGGLAPREGGPGGMAGLFLTKTDVVVQGGLDGLAARHRAYANNIANIETPGFQPAEVPFEAQLRRLRDQMADNPALVGRAQILALDPVPDNQAADRVDGNGVQADRQVTLLAESTLTYEALSQAARLREGLLRSAITEGKA